MTVELIATSSSVTEEHTGDNADNKIKIHGTAS